MGFRGSGTFARSRILISFLSVPVAALVMFLQPIFYFLLYRATVLLYCRRHLVMFPKLPCNVPKGWCFPAVGEWCFRSWRAVYPLLVQAYCTVYNILEYLYTVDMNLPMFYPRSYSVMYCHVVLTFAPRIKIVLYILFLFPTLITQNIIFSYSNRSVPPLQCPALKDYCTSQSSFSIGPFHFSKWRTIRFTMYFSCKTFLLHNYL